MYRFDPLEGTIIPAMPRTTATRPSPPDDELEGDEGDPKCKKFACAFQYCLARHNHDVDRCRALYEAFRRCNEKNAGGGENNSEDVSGAGL